MRKRSIQLDKKHLRLLGVGGALGTLGWGLVFPSAQAQKAALDAFEVHAGMSELGGRRYQLEMRVEAGVRPAGTLAQTVEIEFASRKLEVEVEASSTDALSPSSFPIRNLHISNGIMQFSTSAPSGTQLQIEFSEDLKEWKTWEVLEVVRPGMSFVLPVGQADQRFFRAKQKLH